jgi:hypothetical protein
MRKIGPVACIVLLAACSGGGGASEGGAGSDGGDAAPGGGGGSGDAAPGSESCTPSPNACADGCNPCTRLSDAQVAMVVGQSVKGQWNGDVCEWDFADAQGDLSFAVALHVNTDYRTFEDECHPGGAPVAGITVTPVTGVGDDACTITTTIGSLGSFDLSFLKGCDAYAVSIVGPVGKSPPFSDAMVQAFEKTLALDAEANL